MKMASRNLLVSQRSSVPLPSNGVDLYTELAAAHNLPRAVVKLRLWVYMYSGDLTTEQIIEIADRTFARA